MESANMIDLDYLGILYKCTYSFNLILCKIKLFGFRNFEANIQNDHGHYCDRGIS